jgi:hypothetical protein
LAWLSILPFYDAPAASAAAALKTRRLRLFSGVVKPLARPSLQLAILRRREGSGNKPAPRPILPPAPGAAPRTRCFDAADDEDPGLRFFDRPIRILHWLTVLLVAAVFVRLHDRSRAIEGGDQRLASFEASLREAPQDEE